MIHSITADSGSFRAARFEPGLNLILADRHSASTKKDTRNGVGKSLLLDIIHYCLGSNRFTNGPQRKLLSGWNFRLDLSVAGQRLTAARSIAESGQVIIAGDLPDELEHARLAPPVGSKNRALPVTEWRRHLGIELFDLPTVADGSRSPTFRTLASYLMRRRPEAYLSPLMCFARQPALDQNSQVSYLLGMNWEYGIQSADLQTQEKSLRDLRSALKAGVVAGMSGTMGELEARRVQLEQEVETSGIALRNFKVHPQSDAVPNEANRLTEELHRLTNRNLEDRSTLARYRESVDEEEPPPALSLERLYEEAGVLFPDTVKQTLAEARSFHRTIVANRREFLASAIDRKERQITERENMIEKLTNDRATVLQVLETHGALNEYTALQERQVALRERLEAVKTQIGNVERLRTEQRALDTKRRKIEHSVKADYDERRSIREAAVRWFNENSQALYRSPGTLVIDVGDRGYDYRTEIDRSRSEGVERMQIFCFDLAVLQLQKHLGRGMDFLIHDSLMFDPVDTRQRARALERAHRVTSEIGAQYICTLNSDMVPEKDFSEGFDYEQFVRLRLSDESPEGRLLGIHF